VSATPGAWARAYRPLRPRSLTVQLVVLVLAEVALYSSYADHDALFHWATHFLVALGFTALLLLGRLLVTGVPGPRYLLLTLLGFHLYAMAPDLLFRGGVPHYRWMDVFLGHVAAHYLPGGDLAWLLIALACTAGYVTALTLWLRARHSEAQAGLPPGVGVTGAAVLRPQLDPRRHQLVHEHHGDGREPTVLVHALGASAAFWRPVARQLAAAGYVSLVPDPLGFGPPCASARTSTSTIRPPPSSGSSRPAVTTEQRPTTPRPPITTRRAAQARVRSCWSGTPMAPRSLSRSRTPGRT